MSREIFVEDVKKTERKRFMCRKRLQPVKLSDDALPTVLGAVNNRVHEEFTKNIFYIANKTLTCGVIAASLETCYKLENVLNFFSPSSLSLCTEKLQRSLIRLEN